MEDATPTFCQKCGTTLTPGRGDFYVVQIEAHAEASPPVITAADLAQDHAQAMQDIAAELRDISPQEAMDGVYRRMQFFLCTRCYRKWIEDPVG